MLWRSFLATLGAAVGHFVAKSIGVTFPDNLLFVLGFAVFLLWLIG